MNAYRVVEALLEDEADDFFTRHLDKMAYPSPDQVKYELYREHESTHPDFEDAQDNAWVADQLRRGNLWAWFVAHCEATWRDPEGNEYAGHDYLGGCSYRSRKDFMAPGGYWDDMKDQAYDELIKAVRKARGGSTEEQRR